MDSPLHTWLQIKDWSTYQHYRDRDPVWIKVYLNLLDNYGFYRLSQPAQLLMFKLWLLAAKLRNRIPNEPEFLSRTLCLAVTQELIQEVVTGGWVVETDDEPEAWESPWPTRRVAQVVKDAVWKRDKGRCRSCKSKENLEYDHVVPVSAGGDGTEDNIQLLCRACNRRKRSKVAGSPAVRSNRLQTATDRLEPREEKSRNSSLREEASFDDSIADYLDGPSAAPEGRVGRRHSEPAT